MASVGDIISGLEILIKLFTKLHFASEKLKSVVRATKKIKRIVGKLDGPNFNASEDAAEEI